jgi:hypothetical protein
MRRSWLKAKQRADLSSFESYIFSGRELVRSLKCALEGDETMPSSNRPFGAGNGPGQYLERIFPMPSLVIAAFVILGTSANAQQDAPMKTATEIARVLAPFRECLKNALNEEKPASNEDVEEIVGSRCKDVATSLRPKLIEVERNSKAIGDSERSVDSLLQVTRMAVYVAFSRTFTPKEKAARGASSPVEENDAASDKPFNPVRESLGWSSRQNIIDIEIHGAKEPYPYERIVFPDRLLRFRLDRSYVGSYFPGGPKESEILNLAVLRPNGLSDALVTTVSTQDRFHRDIPGIPSMPFAERLRKNTLVEIHSGYLAESFEDLFRRTRRCILKDAGYDLHKVVGGERLECRIFGQADKAERWVSTEENDPHTILYCTGDDSISCQAVFPFKGFQVKARFHRDALADWKGVITFVDAFLRSKMKMN